MISIPQYGLDGLGGEFKVTEEVENSIKKLLGVRHVVMLTSGTVAIFLALRAIGAKKVAIPNLTMMGTATAAELAGCDLVFVSNNEIPEGVDAYVHVSLNGRDCGIDRVMKANSRLTIIEDACQSFGSQHNGRYLGTFGKVGCFSFSPHKIISAGNGGCIVTNDDDIAREVRRLKNFGRESGGADQHDFIGYNFKFTDIQASFMLTQLKDLENRIEKKKQIYSRYMSHLATIMRPHASVPWFVDIYVDDRDALATYLAEKGIGTRKMYPLLTTQKPFRMYIPNGDTSLDTIHSEKGLWLPSFFDITNEQIDFISKNINTWLESRKSSDSSVV